MSLLGDLFKAHDISRERLVELIKALQANPMGAMTYLHKLNLPPEVMQKMMGIVLTVPQAISDFAQELGISGETVNKIKDKMSNVVSSLANPSSDDKS